MKGKKKRVRAFSVFFSLLILLTAFEPISGYAMPKEETPDYKVAFYAFDCYHMQDENGKRSGYG